MCVKCTRPDNPYARAFVATSTGYALPANDQYMTIDELKHELDVLYAYHTSRKKEESETDV